MDKLLTESEIEAIRVAAENLLGVTNAVDITHAKPQFVDYILVVSPAKTLALLAHIAAQAAENYAAVGRYESMKNARNAISCEVTELKAKVAAQAERIAELRDCLEDIATRPVNSLDTFCWCYTDLATHTMAMVLADQHLPKCERTRKAISALESTIKHCEEHHGNS